MGLDYVVLLRTATAEGRLESRVDYPKIRKRAQELTT